MSAPEKIYLQWADEESDEDYNEITWCVDQIDDTDVEYSRVTLEELAALRRVAEAARNHDLMAGAPSNRDGECYFCGGGVMHAVYCDYHKWRTELNAALAEYDKCRAE